MASTQIPKSADALISLATDAADGANTQGPAIGLSQNTAAKILADLVSFRGEAASVPPTPGAQNLHNAAKAAKVAASALRRTGESNARAYCASAVGLLKNYLGSQWNSSWQAAGFTAGSLAIPDDVLSLLGQIRGYFSANPANENMPLALTAAGCASKMDELTAVRAASNQSNQDLGIAKMNRDLALTNLFQRLSGLRMELDQLLTDDDPRWYFFGFDRPADGWQPGPVDHLVLTGGSPGMVFANWDDARRANRYRVFKQVPGTDPAPVEISATVTDSQYSLTGLVSGSSVQITITAVNEAGDGALSATGTILVP